MAGDTVQVKHVTNSLANIAEWCMRLYSVLSEVDPNEPIGGKLQALRKTKKDGVVPISIGCPPNLDELCEEFCKKRKKPKRGKAKAKGKKKAKVKKKAKGKKR